jgi:hypothetical protein
MGSPVDSWAVWTDSMYWAIVALPV